MRPLLQEISTAHTPESLAGILRRRAGMVLLRSGPFDPSAARYSFVAADPFLVFKSFGSRCEITNPQLPAPDSQLQFGNPWQILDALMARCELLEQVGSPFPLGGAFGYWGYDLKNFTEPKLPRRAENDLELPDCHVGFYDSVVAFDHQLGKTSVVSTGLAADGSRCAKRAAEKLEFWKAILEKPELPQSPRDTEEQINDNSLRPCAPAAEVSSSLSREEFVARVQRVQNYIRCGDIYQANLSHRLTAAMAGSGWELFQRLAAVSPAPFSAFLDCDGFEIASSSPEQFLRMSGAHIVTRPIKGTRPRAADAARDAQLAHELQTSAKELAELVMITDLLRNDLGKICGFGSVRTPEIAKLEKFAQVQHLVSTVEGRLRDGVTHLAALASAFPGGSVTGAPKFRAMEIIDELEPLSRGPYCGCIGYLGFNRESQLNIAIRTAVCQDGRAHFNVGAGIVADSDPGAEHAETLAKARGFLAALASQNPTPGRRGTDAG